MCSSDLEKVLAAHRAGIKKILLPMENKSDLEEIPEKVKRKIKFVLVDNMNQVLDEVLILEGDKIESD